MCGRYVIAYDPQTLVAGFSLTRIQPFDRRWNVTPQSAVPVVYETRAAAGAGAGAGAGTATGTVAAGGERVAGLMRWGLVPHWARDVSIGAKLNNARSEGMADKPSFRQAVRRRRCILPASGFYEWQATTGADGKPAKQPWYISPVDRPFFAMAGLFEAWRAPAAGGAAGDAAGGAAGAAGADDTGASAQAGEWLLTCCVITTAANALMAPIHDRMPVMLTPEHWAAWLSRGVTDPAALAPLMSGLPDSGPGAMQAWPVARTVGRSSNEGPELVLPLIPPLPGR